MMPNHPKIEASHLQRQACVYIRQSSLKQVEQNLESQDLQYQLVQRAQTLGWRKSQVVVIDDDLGKSAVTAVNRAGFQSLVSAVGLNQVGLILVIDVSRLARNCSDWYRLLDLAALCDCLIGDANALYNPRDYNDRLLLGLKGTLAEAQWHSMRQRLSAARLNKARRGELALRLPVGYDRDAEGRVLLSPDREVQGAIRLVFALFERLGSARAVLRQLVRQQLQLPYRIQEKLGRDEMGWRRPSYSAVYQILKHPAYAGAYSYGKHHRVRLPAGKVVVQRVALEKWEVLIPDAFPAYISWEQYMHNQERLRENAQGTNWNKGAPRKGEALLQGLVICGRCGRHMRVRTGGRNPAYACYEAHRSYGAPRCQHFVAGHIDQAVVSLFLEAIQPARLEVALAAVEQIEAQRQQLAEQWEQRLARAEYETELARRRYERVDPDNRLVAAELEQCWEVALQSWQQVKQDWQRVQQQELGPLSEADRQLIRQLADDLPALWHAESTTNAERKRLLRCLIQDVTLDRFSQPHVSLVHVRWLTGSTTSVEVARPQPGGPPAPPELIARIRELAQRYPDDQVADILRSEGLKTARDGDWTTLRVRHFRNKHRIPSACPYTVHSSGSHGPRGDGLVSARQAAQRLNTSPSMIADWFHRGLIAGHQRQPRSPIWVRMDDEDVRRYAGSASLAPSMVPLPQVEQTLGLDPAQLARAVQAGQVLTYRLRDGQQWRWYVQPLAQLPSSSIP
jgi:DNA invertase Pin-like site-specific DNA recombinase